MADTASAAVIGAGATLSHSVYGTYDAPFVPTGTLLVELTDVKFPNVTATTPKATHYTSPKLTHEYITGWTDSGEVDFECHYSEASMTALNALVNTRQGWRITVSDGAGAHTVDFAGILNAQGGDIPLEEVVMLKYKIRVTGAIVVS